MATIRVYQTIENDNWKLTFVNDPEKLSETDRNLMRMYGEPEIEMGGTFLSTTMNEFTLPTQKAKIRSDFPFTKSFDAMSPPFDTNTQTKVNGYRDQIIANFTAAFTTLRANTDTFTGEQLYQI